MILWTLLLGVASVQSPKPPDVWNHISRDRPALAYLRSSAHELRAGNYPAAIAFLNQVLALDPVDRLAREGRDLARAMVAYSADDRASGRLAPEPEWWPGWMFDPAVVTAAYIAYVALCVATTAWLMTRRRGWLAAAVLCLPLALLPALNAGVRWLRSTRDAATPTAVAAIDTALHEGNGIAYPVRVVLPRGVECRRLTSRAGWAQVEFGSGLVGWLPARVLIPEQD